MTPAILFAIAAQTACLPVTGDVIRAADIAPAVQEFASLPPDTRIGYAPAPGAKRIFGEADLDRVARKLGITLEEKPEVCFEWQLASLSREDFRQALEKALRLPDATIEIIDTSRQPVPDGNLVFDRADLTPPPVTNPEQPVLWQGHVQYGERRRFNVWARVRIAAETSRVVATQPVRAGETVQPGQVRIERAEGFPFDDSYANRLDLVVGQIVLRSLREGDPVPANTLEKPLEVNRMDVVTVTVSNGAAIVRAEGRAEAGGRRGETIPVRNLSSGATFQAKVVGPGQVALQLSN